MVLVYNFTLYDSVLVFLKDQRKFDLKEEIGTCDHVFHPPVGPWQVVAPDMMGHGLSSAPKDPSQYTFSQMLDQVTLVFDLFVPQGRKCVVIGHGYG